MSSSGEKFNSPDCGVWGEFVGDVKASQYRRNSTSHSHVETENFVPFPAEIK
jgi:hypothetical protein